MSVRDWFYNVAGYVGPDELAKIKADSAKDIARAAAGASDAVIAEKQRQASAEIDGALRTFPGGTAHPADKDTTGDVLVTLKKYVNIALVGGAVLGAIYFGALFARALKFAKG